MGDVFIFVGGMAVGFLASWVWFLRRTSQIQKEAMRAQKEVEKEREVWYGFSEFNEKMKAVKEERKRKIIDELKSAGNIQTDKVADLLDISRITAFRYLEELEKEGAIEQVGSFGKDVVYKIRQK